MNIDYFILLYSLQVVQVIIHLQLITSGIAQQVFGVSLIFILKFFCKLLLLFLLGGVIGKLLKLDRVYKN